MFCNTMQSLHMWWMLAIFFLSYWKSKGKRLYNIVENCSLRKVPPSSLAACLCVCFVAIQLECRSPTVPPQWPISLPCLSLVDWGLCSLGCKMETRGWSHYLSRLHPFFSLSLSDSVFLFFFHTAGFSAMWFVPACCFFPSNTHSLQTFLPLSPPLVFTSSVNLMRTAL